MQAPGIPWKDAHLPEMVPEWLWQYPRADPGPLLHCTPAPSCWLSLPEAQHTPRQRGAPAFCPGSTLPGLRHGEHLLGFTVKFLPSRITTSAPAQLQGQTTRASTRHRPRGCEQRLLVLLSHTVRTWRPGPSPDVQTTLGQS